jgi:HPt (histidine-containing phosphotransfer) domain-containing protein
VAAHRLAGTAGTYGHVEAGEAAAGLEAALHRLAEGSPDRGAGEERAWEEGAWKDVLDALACVRAAASASRLG